RSTRPRASRPRTCWPGHASPADPAAQVRRFAVLLEIGLVLRQLHHRAIDRRANSLEEPRQFLIAHQVGDRMMLPRHDALAEHDLDPRVFREQLVWHAEDAAGLAEQVDAVLKRLWNAHVAHGPPERRVLALGDMIVQHDEIADVLDLRAHLVVELVDVGLLDGGAREHLHQPDHAALDQVDAGRLQRLDEAAGQTDRDAVLLPVLAALTRAELDDARLGQHFAFDVRQQRLLRLVVWKVAAAEHDAVADAVLQRNAPLPSCLARDRARVRPGFAHGFGLNRDGAVVLEPPPPPP